VRHVPEQLEAPQAPAAAPTDEAWNQDYLDLLNDMKTPSPAAASAHSAATPSQPDSWMDIYDSYYRNPPVGS